MSSPKSRHQHRNERRNEYHDRQLDQHFDQHLDQHLDVQLKLDPDTVVHVLEAHRPAPDICVVVIRHVKTYSTRLARFVAEEARNHLYTLGRRSSPAENGWTIHYCNMVQHMLQLQLQLSSEDGMDEQLLADRAALLVIYAALLIQVHSKQIKVGRSEGLVQLDSSSDSCLYIDQHTFLHVREACDEVTTVVHKLDASGLKLCNEVKWFLRSRGVEET